MQLIFMFVYSGVVSRQNKIFKDRFFSNFERKISKFIKSKQCLGCFAGGEIIIIIIIIIIGIL